MNNLGMLKELQNMLNQYSAANMIGKDFDCAPVREICKKLNEDNPERFSFVIDDTDHELMVSVSQFFGKLLGIEI